MPIYVLVFSSTGKILPGPYNFYVKYVNDPWGDQSLTQVIKVPFIFKMRFDQSHKRWFVLIVVLSSTYIWKYSRTSLINTDTEETEWGVRIREVSILERSLWLRHF